MADYARFWQGNKYKFIASPRIFETMAQVLIEFWSIVHNGTLIMAGCVRFWQIMANFGRFCQEKGKFWQILSRERQN